MRKTLKIPFACTVIVLAERNHQVVKLLKALLKDNSWQFLILSNYNELSKTFTKSSLESKFNQKLVVINKII